MIKARDYLLEIKKKDDFIQEKILKLSELKYRYYISGGGGTDERVQTSLTADKIGDLIGEVIDLENEIDFLVDDISDYKKQAKRLISALNNTLYTDILYRRYFLFEPVYKVAIDLARKQQTIKNDTSNAMKKLQEVLDIEYYNK